MVGNWIDSTRRESPSLETITEPLLAFNSRLQSFLIVQLFRQRYYFKLITFFKNDLNTDIIFIASSQLHLFFFCCLCSIEFEFNCFQKWRENPENPEKEQRPNLCKFIQSLRIILRKTVATNYQTMADIYPSKCDRNRQENDLISSLDDHGDKHQI